MPVRPNQSRTQSYTALQAAHNRLPRADRNRIRRTRVQTLQRLYEARGGADQLSDSLRLQLDRRAMASASEQFVQANSARMNDGLAQCSSNPSGSACRTGRAMRALQQAAQRYMGQ